MNKLRKLLEGVRNRVSPVPIVALGLVMFWGVVLFRPASEPSRPPAEDKPPVVSVQTPAQEPADASTDTPSGEVLGDEVVASDSDETTYEPDDTYYLGPAGAAAPAPQVSRPVATSVSQPAPAAPVPQPATAPAPIAPPQTQPPSLVEPVQPPEEQRPRISTTVFSLICSVGICL